MTSVSATGGRFEFEDGGVYCGEWLDGKAHGLGICTGPKGEGEYSGAYSFGFEFSGVYTMPKGSTVYQGQWQNGKKHGLGVEYHAKYVYKGEWNQGVKGRYGVRLSRQSQARYEGTWSDGLQDGYGAEMYGDGGTYQGQWLRGMRHGYGIRKSVPFGLAAQYHKTRTQQNSSSNSIHSDQEGPYHHAGRTILASQPNVMAERNRGGFVLRNPTGKNGANNTDGARRSHSEQSIVKKPRFFSRIRKQNSTGDIDHHLDSAGGGTGGSPSDLSGSTIDLLNRSRARSESPGGTTGFGMRASRSASKEPFFARFRRSLSSLDRSGRSRSKSIRKQGSLRSSGSSTSCNSEESSGGKKLLHDVSFDLDENLDPNVTETYIGEWKNDKRSGFGISERSDGLKYEGEWFNNKKYGYGVTTTKDGIREEGKYKNNVLVTAGGKRRAALFVLRSAKLRERIEAAAAASNKANQTGSQKSEIAGIRVSTARERASQADLAAAQARTDSENSRDVAIRFGADLKPIVGPDISEIALQPGDTNGPIPNHHPSKADNPNRLSKALDGVGNHVAPQQRSGSLSRPPAQQTRFVPQIPALPAESNTVDHDDNSDQQQQHEELQQQQLLQQQQQHIQQLQQQQLQQQQQQQQLLQLQRQQLQQQQQQQQELLEIELEQQQLQHQQQNNLAHPVNDRTMLGSSQQQLEASTLQHHQQQPIALGGPVARSSSGAGPIGRPNGGNLVRSSSSAGGPTQLVEFAPQGELQQPSIEEEQQLALMAELGPSPELAQRRAVYAAQRGAISQDTDFIGPPAAQGGTYTIGVHSDRFTATRTAHQLSTAGGRRPSWIQQPNISAGSKHNPLIDTLIDPHQLPAMALEHAGSGIVPDDNLAINVLRSRKPPHILSELAGELPPLPPEVAQLPHNLSLAGSRASRLLKEGPPGQISCPPNEPGKGSMPDLTLIGAAKPELTRAEASQLSSARRREMHRLREDEDARHHNPLLYLHHPSFQSWLQEQRLLISVVLLNLLLALVFYYLVKAVPDDGMDEDADYMD